MTAAVQSLMSWPVMWWLAGRPESSKGHAEASTVTVQPNVDVWSDRGLPPWVEPLFGRLRAVLSLQNGWDGANASPITSSALVAALMVLQETMAWDTVPPAVVPVADGGMQLEWHCTGVDLEVYIDPDGSVSAWCREGSREWEEDFYPRARLRKELSLLTSDFC